MNKICRTCLTKDRRMTPITSDHRQMLRWMNIRMKIDASICWECEGQLAHLARFRTRVMKAQRTMNLCRGRVTMLPNMQSLSCMTVRHSDIYDVTIDAESDTVIKHDSRPADCERINFVDVGANNFDQPSTSGVNDFTVECKIEPESDNEHDNDNHENENFNNQSMLEEKIKIETEVKTEANENEDEDEWEEMMIQPEVVFYDEEKNDQYTKEDFYEMITMSAEELEAAREADRNGARYKFCPFKCESCIVGYYHKELLDKHKAERHSESAVNECPICQQHFFSPENLESHQRAHFHGYRCRACHYTHHRHSAMDVHFVKCHKNSSKRCSPCTLYFPNYRMLKYHRETVHRELPTCAHCGRQYKTKAILKRHLVRHEATEQFECRVCHKYYRGRAGLVDHMRRHRYKQDKLNKKDKEVVDPYCADCDMTFKNIASYKNHLHFSLKHKGPEAMERYTCKTCGKRFQNKPAVQRHMEAIHLSDTACTICRDVTYLR